MSAPVTTGQSQLLTLLGLVDESRARAEPAEQQFISQATAIYAQQLAVAQQHSEDEGHPLITAAVLATVVTLIRGAVAAGAAEGARFAQEQFQVLGVPDVLFAEVELPLQELGDQLVRDFLAGQVAESKERGDRELLVVFEALHRRALAAIVSSYQTGRGVAVESLFAQAAEVLNSSIHKLWVARFDLNTPPCKLCVRLHGQHIPVTESFPVPKDEPAPYRGSLPGPPRHINCKCSLVLFFPDMLDLDEAATPLTMQAYAKWALNSSEEDRSAYVAATLVHVKAYTRVVDGKVQHVSGYYYDIQTGQKIPEGAVGNPAAVKQVNAQQAKSLSKVSKAANAATPKGGDPDLEWKPGTYRVDSPNSPHDTQVVVHQDGSSTAIHNGETKDSDKATTAQYLAQAKQLGVIQKISDDPDVPDPDGAGPGLEPSEEGKKQGLLAEGWYLFKDNKDWGGIRVDHDKGEVTAKLYRKNFQKSINLKEVAIRQITNGNLGKYEEVDEEEFKSPWHKDFDQSKAGGANKPQVFTEGMKHSTDQMVGKTEPPGKKEGGSGSSASASTKEGDPGSASAKDGSAGSASSSSSGSTSAQEGSASASSSGSAIATDEPPEAPQGGPGGVVKDGPSLFSVGMHSVQVEEGAQVYKSGKSKDTLYVLKPDGDLVKYNPQGAGVQATLVGSSDNKVARAQLLASLNNVTDDGIDIKHSIPTPGTGKALVGGFEMTASQIDAALYELESNPSGNVVADLKKAGSPLAAGNFHAVAAPYKAYHNNKTKPALIQALKNAKVHTGSTPLSEAPAVHHLEKDHGLEGTQAQLGLSDTEAIHDALHEIDPDGQDHDHSADAPGFISLGGTPMPPQIVKAAIDALVASPKAETGIKKPLKAASSPLAGLPLHDLANASPITDKFKGSNGKVHYGKLKPAVIAMLQSAYDEHSSVHPPISKPDPEPLPSLSVSVDGVFATKQQIRDLQEFFTKIDLDEDTNWKQKLAKNFADNPLAQVIDWDQFAGNVPSYQMNAAIQEKLSSYLNKKKIKSAAPMAPPPPEPDVLYGPQEDTSPSVSLPNGVSGSLDQLLAYQALVNAESVESQGHTVKVPGNPFSQASPLEMMKALDVHPPENVLEHKAALSDAIQKKIDLIVQKAKPTANVAPSTGTISVGGKQVTKDDLLVAVEALEQSSLTGIKGPLKSVNSPLANVDVKAYIEADPLSDKYKGSNGKVHYGKLKSAVVDVLKAKAEGMTDAPAPEVDDITHVGSEEDISKPEQLDGVDPDPSPSGTYMGAAGTSLKVFEDGSGEISNPATGTIVILTPDQVNYVVSAGGVEKISDSVDDIGQNFVKGVQVGTYNYDPLKSVTVFSDGAVLVNSLSGKSVLDVNLAKPHLKSSGIAPVNEEINDPWDWLKDAVKDKNGFALGKYNLDGDIVTVSKDGPDSVTPEVLAKAIIDGKTHPAPDSVVFEADLADLDKPDAPETPESPEGSDVALESEIDAENAALLQALAKQAAGYPNLDPFLSSTTKFALAFQLAAKSGKVVYRTGGKNPLSVAEPGAGAPLVSHWQHFPDGSVHQVSGSGEVLKKLDFTQVNNVLDGAFGTLDEDLDVDVDFDDDVNFDMPPPGEDDGGFEGDGFEADVDSEPAVEPEPPAPESAAPDTSNAVPSLPLLQPMGHIKLDYMDKPKLQDSVKKYAEASGLAGVIGLHLNTAKKEDLVAWLKHWANGEWDKAYDIESAKVKNHKTRFTHPGSPLNPDNAGGFKKKAVTPSVPGETPASETVPGIWPASADWFDWDIETTDKYLLAANMQNPTGLHDTNKRVWAAKHHAGDAYVVNNLSLYAAHATSIGAVKSAPIIPVADTYGPGQAIPLPPDFPEIDLTKSKALNLSNTQLDKYLSHFGSKKTVEFLMSQPTATKQALVSLHAAGAALPGDSTFKPPEQARAELSDLLTKMGSFVIQSDSEGLQKQIHNLLQSTPKSFTMDKEQPYLEGTSTLYHVTDEAGEPWLFKVGKSQHRIDIEDAAHGLYRLSGVPVATSIPGSFHGQIGQFQSKIPSKSTLRDVDPMDLPLSALKDLMTQHVMDWTTNNDDSVGRNFLLSPDGQRVYQIDIARAYARFGQPGSVTLKRGKLSNWEELYYEGIYQGIVNGKFSEKEVAQLYRASMKQAKKTQAVDDAAWDEVLRKGTAKRPKYDGTSANNQDELIEHALARKNSLVDDFDKFWDSIYSEAGLTKPTSLSKLSENVYTGVSQDHIDAAKAMGYAGHSTFFAGTELEDGHLLAQVAHTSDGGEQLWLSGQLREDADKKLTKWMTDNLTDAYSGASAGSSDKSIEQKSTEMLQKLGLDDAFDRVLGAVKTISHHHKNGDKNYNTARLNAMLSLQEDLQVTQGQIESGVYPSALDSKDHQHFSDMINYYLSQIDQAITMRDTGGQSTKGQFVAFDFKLTPDPAVPEPVKTSKKIKVKVVDSYFDGGDLDDNLNFAMSGEKKVGKTNGQSGRMFVATLEDGTEIEYRSWHKDYGIPLAQQGQLRIRVRKHDGSTAGAAAAVQQLQSAGLSLKEATDEDHELFYWRHLYGILQDRADRNKGKNQDVVSYVKANLPGGTEGTPALQAKEELERWREAWSRLTSKEQVTQWVDKQKYLPRFSHPNPLKPEMRGGQPYWVRFDVDHDNIMNRRVLVRKTTGSGSSLKGAVVGGGFWSTEDRTKYLGWWIPGMSSGEQQSSYSNDQKTGASNFSFLTQYGKSTDTGVKTSISYQSLTTYQMVFSPALWARTSMYGFSSDDFGRVWNRKENSYFSFDGSEMFSGTPSSSNEIQIKHGLTLLDDIEMIRFPTDQAYNDMVALMHARGITEIRGVPIETRFVKPGEDPEKALKEIQAALKTWREGFGDDDE